MNIRQSAKVLAPFDSAFPGTYVIQNITTAEDGQVIVFLEGIEGAFSPVYLEVVA